MEKVNRRSQANAKNKEEKKEKEEEDEEERYGPSGGYWLGDRGVKPRIQGWTNCRVCQGSKPCLSCVMSQHTALDALKAVVCFPASWA